MENEEFGQLLSKIDKKLDKILNLQTKIAKALHLLPVTEKEERALQIQQRTNLNIAAKITAELDNMENKGQEDDGKSLAVDIYGEAPAAEVYSDIIGDDILS